MKSKTRAKPTRPPSFAAGVGRALRRAAKDAQKLRECMARRFTFGKKGQSRRQKAIRLTLWPRSN